MVVPEQEDTEGKFSGKLKSSQATLVVGVILFRFPVMKSDAESFIKRELSLHEHSSVDQKKEVCMGCLDVINEHTDFRILQSEMEKQGVPEEPLSNVRALGRRFPPVIWNRKKRVKLMLEQLSEIKNGFKIFYDCLLDTQLSVPGHAFVVVHLEFKAKELLEKPRDSQLVSNNTIKLSHTSSASIKDPEYLESEETVVYNGAACSYVVFPLVAIGEQGLILPDKKSSENDLQDKPRVTKEALSYSIHRNWSQINFMVLSRKLRLFHKRITKDELLEELETTEDGYEIFYRCLRETQDVCPGHRIVADDIEMEAKQSLSSLTPGGYRGEEQDEPRVTKESFISYMQYSYIDFYILRNYEIFMDLLHEKLFRLQNILNEAEMQYFLYRICEKQDGPQLFYHRLRQIQQKNDSFRHLADGLQREAQRLSMKSSVDPDSKFVSTEPEVLETKVSLSYSGNQCSFSDVPGLHLNIPASTECSTTTELTFEVVYDDYILPEGYEEMPLVSEMYKITTRGGPLPVPVTVRMEHCAVVEEEDCLIHMIVHGPPPYQFQPLPGGKFPIGESYGEIVLEKFCTLTQCQRRRKPISLSVHLFYHNKATASFVATRNLPRLVRAVKKRYARTNSFREWSMSCDVHAISAISLVIPRPPQSGGWMVEPDFKPPKIETRLIRKYIKGMTPPVVNLSMRWTGEGPAIEERIKIKLKGVSLKSFVLECSSEFTLPPLSPTAHLVPASPEASSLQTPPAPLEAPLSLRRQGPSSVAGASSPEARALRRCNMIFTTDGDPEYLARLLYSKALLTTEEKARTMNPYLTDTQKLEEIFQSMERRVSTNPSHLHTLVEALSTEAALQGVAEKIQECYDEERRL